MRKNGILFFLFLFFFLSGYGQKEDISFLKYDLPNGLKVLLHQDTTVPVVAVSVLYHVGSKNEQPGQSGFAHFFEHLMFEGSENIGRGQFMKYVSNAGGRLNANTSSDRTFYYENLPSNQLKLALWLESERMLHAKIENQGVNTQREVVKEEKRMRYDNRPYGTILQEISKRLLKGTPYEWTTIGTMEDLDRAELSDFITFYKTFYVPQNAVLSIAGNIQMDSTKQLIESYFGPIPKGEHEIPRPEIKLQPLGDSANVIDTIYDNIQLPAVIEAYRGPTMGSKDYYAFQLLSTLLSGGSSSRMQKEIKDKKELALQISSIPLSMEDAGTYINLGLVNFGVAPDTLQKEIDKQIDAIKNTPVGGHEFEKVMNQLEADFIGSYDTQLGIAEQLANYEVYYGDANLINTELERYRAVTPEDVREVANRYLKDSNRIILYYLPKQ